MIAAAHKAARLGRFGRKVVRGLFLHHAFDHAATMAFYFFLGTIPLLVLGGLLLGRVVESEGSESVIAPLYRILPGLTRDLIRKELHDIAAAEATSIAPISVVGFLWLTSNGFHNLMDVFELLIGARRRSWLRQRAIAIGWVVATLTVGCFCIWFTLIITGWLDAVTNLPELLRRMHEDVAVGWHKLGAVLVCGTAITLGSAAFYRLAVIHPRAVRRRVWPGTFVAIVLWAIISWAFGAYVATIGDYSVYYGSVATVAVTLLWFYLSSLAFVTGAEVNAQLEGLREPPPSPAL